MKSVIVVLLLVLSSLATIGDSLQLESIGELKSSIAEASCTLHDHQSSQCEPAHSDHQHCASGNSCHSHSSCFHQCLKSAEAVIPKVSLTSAGFSVLESFYQSPSLGELIRPPIS